ncbi:hypothetical protein TVAG_110250 [Trichomonas vaginalis G3]|uniref:Uncharacterized protein n=1 Tax=Trichomonas vaginalis (strain ATCC PRA-98 / G3) TaxID=412133 RepID=A2DGM6_TRIV3|nr:peptide N-glycanase family protein [Trichomonas vaginalis G3]EAY20413.1 hypothetical protein TVAG_110250 [Trichomonas vaginalis G3]KAI5490541.1 peptide N-glycanase family protein [Trichomonas vaginalis G3]|eukprot:XP_001581399.1 hypothetical protein [Trichomonas vaginalis G3]
MLRVRFWYCGKSYQTDITRDVTLAKCFADYAPFLGISQPASDFIMYCPQKQEINATLASVVFNNTPPISTDPIEIYISTKSDSKIMEKFCKDCFHAVKYEAVMMNDAGFKVHQDLNLLHRKILKVYSPPTMNYRELVPNEILSVNPSKQRLLQLITWFTRTYMKKYAKPKCLNCRQSTVVFQEDRPPTRTEKEQGAIGVKRFLCHHCKAAIRIPEYENPELINRVRTGSLIEQCILFGTILRCLDYHVRFCKLISHSRVWLEVFDPEEKRFIPCNLDFGSIENPLIFVGRGIQVAHVVAVGPYDCSDVTFKYTNNIDQVIEERNEIVDEESFQQILSLKSVMWRNDVTDDLIELSNQLTNEDMEHFIPVDREPTNEEKTSPLLFENYTSRY